MHVAYRIVHKRMAEKTANRNACKISSCHTHTLSWHDALGTEDTYSTFPYDMLQKLAY